MSKYVNNIGNRTSAMQNLKDVDIEYRKNKISFVVQVSKLNTKRVESPEEMAERFEQLFQLCIETGNVPNYEALAVACGIPIRTFYDMSNATYDRICPIPADYQRCKGHNCTNGEFYGE